MAGRKKKLSMLKVQYYRSVIGSSQDQRRVVKGLGLRRLNSIRELQDTPDVRGMIAKVPHHVRVVE
jgi:large subunit ribosomal protein L30